MSTRASDVLFVFPPARGNGGGFRHHLGVAYLRAALARDGMTSTQFICRNPGNIDAVAAEIIGRKSPVVGFTAYDENAALCIALARSIKQQDPAVRVVFGGPAATFNAERLMERHAAVDACVRGEAEETARSVFAGLLDGGRFDNAPAGLTFRRAGEVISTPLPELVGAKAPPHSALDCTPSPYLSGILADGRAGVLTGRGCSHHCQYCCFAALARNRLRLHSVDRVSAELEYIAAHRKRTGESYPVTVHDDAFTLLPSRAKTLCERIAERRLNLALSCITRADTVDEELLRLMQAAGFVSLAFGLESAVPRVLRATGKVRPPDWHDPDLQPEKDFLERVRTSVLLAKKYGFRVGVSIILGLPTETAADAAETLRFVRSLGVDYYMHNFLWIFPGTPLWQTHDRYGIRCTTDSLGLSATTQYAYDVTSIRPLPNCALEGNAQLARLLATDALYGCEASAISAKGIGAVVVHGALSAKTADWLRGMVNVGGVVIQVFDRDEDSRRADRDRSLIDDRLVPVRQHIQLQRRKSTRYDESWRATSPAADLYAIHQPALLSINAEPNAAPLRAWAQGQACASVCDVSGTFEKTNDLISLLNRIAAEGAAAMPAPPALKYSGRWVIGKAPCRSFTRIEIDAHGDVRCCRHGEPIGKVGDSARTLSRRLSAFAKAAERRRGCADCSSTGCPRCPFPGVDEKTYCAFMRRHAQARRLFNSLRVYSRLPLLVAIQQDDRAAAG